MMDSGLALVMRTAVRWLELPALWGLVVLSAWSLWDAGTALGERWRGLRRLEHAGDALRAERVARRRIERADVLARVGPMLGLAGTLIPLGPGLAALGGGDMGGLAQAVTVAFDTTVLGLLVGLIGFITGRLRRRWYDQLLDRMEAAHG
jgi:hypothetical protein